MCHFRHNNTDKVNQAYRLYICNTLTILCLRNKNTGLARYWHITDSLSAYTNKFQKS